MTLTLTPELEQRLNHWATKTGEDPTDAGLSLLDAALDLDWEAQERAETIVGIQRGLDDVAAGRLRPIERTYADMRAKLSAAGL